MRCGRDGAARRQARVATGDGREGEGRASGEAEPFFGQLDPGRAVEQVEEDEHALPRRQAALDDCGEAPERSARDGHRTAGKRNARQGQGKQPPMLLPSAAPSGGMAKNGRKTLRELWASTSTACIS